MGKSEEIARLVREAGGVASAAQITEAGFLPGSISHALKSGAIDKLTRGSTARRRCSTTSSPPSPTDGGSACSRTEARSISPGFPTGFPARSTSPSPTATIRGDFPASTQM